jgi:hypothetical protein
MCSRSENVAACTEAWARVKQRGPVSVRLPHSEAVPTGPINYLSLIIWHECVLLVCTRSLCVGKLLFSLSHGAPDLKVFPMTWGGVRVPVRVLWLKASCL